MKEWDSFLEQQEKNLGKEAIHRWAKTLKVADFDAGNLYLETQDPFQLHWFEQHLRPLLKQSFHNMNGRPIQVHLLLKGEGLTKTKKHWKPPLDLTPDSLSAHFTFDTFFAYNSNQLNINLFKEALLKKTFNPIYVQGASDTGKTHLLMAACHFLKNQGKKCFYVTTDRFTQHIVAAIRSGAMHRFREIYRENDVLALDGVEMLADRTASQEELFHTFNSLHFDGKTLLLAGTQLPSYLKGIEPRLTSRFEWGLILSLAVLTQQEKGDYFKQILQQKQITLEPDMIKFSLSLFSSIPLLNRAADILKMRLKKAPASVEALKSWFSLLIQEQQKNSLTSEMVLKTIVTHFDIRLSDLIGRSQIQEHVIPRQVAMYLCRQKLGLTYVEISKLFSRDHSTVMSSVRLIEKKLKENQTLKASVDEILRSLR